MMSVKIVKIGQQTIGDIMIPKGHERWIDRIREYNSMKDKYAQYEIVNKIEELSKQLDGYIEDYQ